MTLAVSWMVLQPAGGAAYVERGVVTAPDRRCALATARQHYGAAVTVQSALSWRVALASGPA